jgi:hypothetical protein
MAMIEGIRAKFERRQYEFSKHAVDQSIIRDISVAEVEDAISGQSEIIEKYPKDKYGPSCLVLGFTKAGGRYMFSAATQPDHLSRSSPCTSPILICGSISGSEGEMKEH